MRRLCCITPTHGRYSLHDLLTTSSTGSFTLCFTDFPAIILIILFTAVSAFSSTFCLMVVSSGIEKREYAISSYPETEISSGTLIPFCDR